MVMVLDAKFAVKPGGKLEGIPIPVAPVVTIVISDGNTTPEQTEGLEDGASAVLLLLTVTANISELEVPQSFPAVTLMLPFCPAEPAVTVIDVVP
jgi:hypothetical protein